MGKRGRAVRAAKGMRVRVFSPDMKEDWGWGKIIKVEQLVVDGVVLSENYPSEIRLSDTTITEGLKCWWATQGQYYRAVREAKSMVPPRHPTLAVLDTLKVGGVQHYPHLRCKAVTPPPESAQPTGRCSICYKTLVGKQKKYCELCAPVAQKEMSKEWRRKHYYGKQPGVPGGDCAAPVYLITCSDCGKDLIALNSAQVRCKECADLKKLIYVAMKELRGAIATKAIVEPDQAVAFVKQMVEEDGQEFKSWAVDGIVERIVVDKRAGTVRRPNPKKQHTQTGGADVSSS